MQQALSPDDIPRSVGRVLDLLEIVLAEGSCNLTTAAGAAGLTPTTALRHLRALEARGYLDRDDAGVFTAGPTVRRLAAAIHDGGPLDRLIDTAQPHLDSLAAETGESAYLAVGGRGVATYLATAESPRSIRHVGWVGQNLPLDGTAVGDALTSPGAPATRTGAVEPDITAISLALPPFESLGAAISVVGPAHRLDRKAQRVASAALALTVDALCLDLGIDLDQLDQDAS
ncbi:MAG: IclR family transcriptional regulator [Acidimicrobiales bacterium]